MTLHIAPNGLPPAAQRDAASEAAEADRRWFLAHPERRHRIRRALPGETQTDPGLTAFVVIRQERTGFRVRIAFGVKHPPEGEAPEEAARMIFDRFVATDADTRRGYGAILSIAKQAEART
jgi:hypothetical protein